MSVALRAEPSPTISTINLVITIVSLITTVPTLLPRPLPQRLIRCLRFTHTLLLLSPISLSLYTLSTLLNDPLQSISTQSANIPIHQILDLTATSFNSTTGFTRFLLTPGSGDVETSLIPHISIVFMTVVAACVITAKRTAVRRQASLLAFGITTAYVLGALLTAFQPGTLDRDSSVLTESWLDERFKEIEGVNETRFLSNVWLTDADVGSNNATVTNSMEIDKFRDKFCENFNELPVQADLVVDLVDDDGVPITRPPSTSAAGTSSTATSTAASTSTSASTTTTTTTEEEEEEDDRPQVATRQSSDEIIITRNLLSQILIVYTVGKPLYTTYGKSLSLLSLPFLTLSPVFIGYATRSSVLYPFIVGWVGLLLLLIVYATPETLRWVGVGFESSDLMTFCGRRYQVFVTDDVTYRVGVFDMVTFGLIVVIGVLQGFRWMRVREQEKEDEGDVKMMGYDEVYSQNGALRW